MPTYDYRCEKGHVFELVHSIKDETPKSCPECGSPAKRVPSGGAGLLFKGSGFYITDYRSKGYQESAKAEKGGSSGGESAKPAGSESKGSGGESSKGGGDASKAGGSGGESPKRGGSGDSGSGSSGGPKPSGKSEA